MQTKNLTPFAFGTKVTSRRPRELEMTLVVRGRFRLHPNEPVAPLGVPPGATSPPPEAILEQGALTGDLFADDDEVRVGELVYASDFADFKVRADVLLRGSCHAPGRRAVTECPVRFTVGAWSKSLRVVGRRVWTEKLIGQAISDPAPFVTMPIVWANAFGAPDHPANPVGRGPQSPELPTIEVPDAPIRSRTSRPEPAGFGSINPAWPLRRGKVGNEYGASYRRTRAPFYSEDFDWRYFSAAPASNKGVGMNMGFPDVCLTPSVPAPIPIPYPNIAMNAMAAPFCPTILLTCMPALNMASMIPMTLGDQPGVANPLFMQMGRYTMGNPKILLEALPAINLTCPTTGNMMNNPVGAVLVPSVTNIFFTRALPGCVFPHTPGPSLSSRPAGSREGAAILDRAAVREIVDSMSPGAGSTVEVADLGGGIAHLRIRAFAATVASDVYAEVQRMRPASMVIDLRGNRGGELTSFLALAADFLPRESEICTIVDGEGDVEVRRAQHDPLYDMPVVVVVGGATASAAELFAGCLQAHRRAIIVGERTFGKATHHVLFPREDGAGYVTTGRCLLPGGFDLQGSGVTPDVAVTSGEDPLRVAALGCVRQTGLLVA